LKGEKNWVRLAGQGALLGAGQKEKEGRKKNVFGSLTREARGNCSAGLRRGIPALFGKKTLSRFNGPRPEVCNLKQKILRKGNCVQKERPCFFAGEGETGRRGSGY